ncbi:uncharacterized protein MONBRDRAFT_37569 [Monosiga brevicollis MX1]|uniref:TAP42-like protein n=1 Tax=Monosiga brevicollis TaxID=81824 RepID=A9V2K7_MONBE|nr:uncharacterized protein MONBRDRAFT_37569 [Monosiga brevicollis MX1]EDQ88393.1 predicted protein [Monosiga brevicollis MX1]|eukprot:XP_001746986.1 hypothetical protein [Monosiga brevicollis MX1]
MAEAGGDSIAQLLSEAEATVASCERSHEAVERAVRQLQSLADLVSHANLFSSNEAYDECSNDTLRCLSVPFWLADVTARRVPSREDPERDAKRIFILKQTLQYYQKFLADLNQLQFPFASAEMLEAYVESTPGIRRSREVKIEHLKALRQTEGTVQELRAAIDRAEAQDDEDLARQHIIALLHMQLLKACEAIDMLGFELKMLEDIEERRRNNEEIMMRPPTNADRPPEKPLVLTKEMVQHMAVTGKSVDRANFKLLTRGYGPIGAPTMSLEEVADREVREALERQAQEKLAAANKQELPENSEEADYVDAMQGRAESDYWDNHKRGEGNRYNHG